MRVAASVLLDCVGGSTVRVTFAQHRIDGAAHDFGVTLFNFGLGVVFRIVWVVRDRVAFGLQFGDRRFGLGDRSTDVGKFDQVCFGRFGQLSQFSQRVVLFLIVF